MKKYPSKACLCAVLSLWTLTGIICFVASLVLYFIPWLQLLRMRATVCQVDSMFFTTQYVCSCGGLIGKSHECTSYPCYVVNVHLNNTQNQPCFVTLFTTFEQMTAVISADEEQQERCTLKVCGGDSLSNREEVNSFSRQVGEIGQTLSCHFDPWNSNQGAILHLNVPGLRELHWVLWPILSIILSVSACLIFCQRCQKSLRQEGPQNDPFLGLGTPPIDTRKKKKHLSLRGLWNIQTGA